MNEHADLLERRADRRKHMDFLYKAKGTHLIEFENVASRPWNDRTKENLLYHAKQIRIITEDMEATQLTIQRINSRLKKIPKY